MTENVWEPNSGRNLLQNISTHIIMALKQDDPREEPWLVLAHRSTQHINCP